MDTAACDHEYTYKFSDAIRMLKNKKLVYTF